MKSLKLCLIKAERNVHWCSTRLPLYINGDRASHSWAPISLRTSSGSTSSGHWKSPTCPEHLKVSFYSCYYCMSVWYASCSPSTSAQKIIQIHLLTLEDIYSTRSSFIHFLFFFFYMICMCVTTGKLVCVYVWFINMCMKRKLEKNGLWMFNVYLRYISIVSIYSLFWSDIAPFRRLHLQSFCTAWWKQSILFYEDGDGGALWLWQAVRRY